MKKSLLKSIPILIILGIISFVGVNPSQLDEMVDDLTIESHSESDLRTSISLDEIPVYSGEGYVVLDNNIPFF